MSGPAALVCAPHLPAFDRESGAQRTWDLLTFLVDAGWEVSFAAKFPAEETRYARLLRQRGVCVYDGAEAIQSALKIRSPDVIVFAFWHLAEEYLVIARESCPSARIVVDSIDLHFLRDSRRIARAAQGTMYSPPLDTDFGIEMVRELNTYASADAVLTVSPKEAGYVNDFLGSRSQAISVPDCEDLPPSPLPFADRRGLLFIGNFWHRPNIEAVEQLCCEILPRVDRALLAEHQVKIVGHRAGRSVIRQCRDSEHVQVVGWVPSITPYIQSARVNLLPLLHGAGTKRKFIQALMVGTPTVSTSIGVEGIDVRDEENVLIADTPELFAKSIERLLADETLWQQLAITGRERAKRTHDRAHVRQEFLAAMAEVLEREPKSTELAKKMSSIRDRAREPYERLKGRIRDIVADAVPSGAKMLVVSRGDEDLVALDGVHASHFPQDAHGNYAGYSPGDGREAIEHLEELRESGSQFLVVPKPYFWWLTYYDEFAEHLESNCRRVVQDDACYIYALGGRRSDPTQIDHDATGANIVSLSVSAARAGIRSVAVRSTAVLEPEINQLMSRVPASAQPPRVLVAGIYLADEVNAVDHIAFTLESSRCYEITQRWASVGGSPVSPWVESKTVRRYQEKVPKFEIFNELLTSEDVATYDFIVIVDDDIALPPNFLDGYLWLQSRLGFALAQPARTAHSYLDHPIVEQQCGVAARETRFVEIGPLFSIQSDAFGLVLPFDIQSPMGWGYENVWAWRFNERGLRMGIIDALPVDHSLRKPVANYSWHEANEQRELYLRANEHMKLHDCFAVLGVTSYEEVSQWACRGLTSVS